MKTVMPDYYSSFRCIADQCHHTCCAGWEIDVDAEALARYGKVQGPLGEKLKANLVLEDDCPHFRLTADERCPFLDSRNLCELYAQLGEASLCQICTDHPRFRNEMNDRTEIGLGLCCEAAGALILGWQQPVRLVSTGAGDALPDDHVMEVYAIRSRAMDIVQDRTMPVQQRLHLLEKSFGIRFPGWTPQQWAEVLLSLERMDEEWTERLMQLRAAVPAKEHAELAHLETAFEQLTVYFLYRHLPAMQDLDEITAYVGFAILSCRVIRWLCELQAEQGGCALNDLIEISRLYSSEIEYCEENTKTLLELLWEANHPEQ